MQIQKYEKELKTKKEEIEIKLQKEFENQLNTDLNGILIEINNKRKNIENKLKQKILNQYKNFENNFEQKFIEMSRITQSKIIQLNEDNKKSNINKCNSVHNNIICKRCFQNPIKEFRYKCSKCNNYNLCENCEEANSISGDHPHNFVKIRKVEDNNMMLKNIKISNNNFNNNYNNNNNIFDNENENKMLNKWEFTKNEELMFSYECLVTKLKCYIFQGANQAQLQIILKNNGKLPWIQ